MSAVKPRYTPPRYVVPTKPVCPTNSDHHMTTRNSVERGPFVSPSQPDGISKMAYANWNAISTQKKSASLTPRSAMMAFLALPFAARSM